MTDAVAVRDAPTLFGSGRASDLPAVNPGDLIRTVMEGFLYEVLAAAPTNGPTLRIADMAVRPIPGPNGFNVAAFGARGNGEADDTAAIQNAIDHAIFGPDRSNVTLPQGRFRLTRTVHIGYGTSYIGLTVAGMGKAYRGNIDRFTGTVLVADFDDQPAINIQGGRGTKLTGLTLVGRNNRWIADNSLGHPRRAQRRDTAARDWVDPALPERATSRYAPYAGIALDAYSGERTQEAYPRPDLPPWLDDPDAFGGRTSSNTTIADVTIIGFVVGLAIQPAQVDANGDFTTFHDGFVERCIYAVSVGNSQSRNVSIRNTEIHQVWCAFTNRVHGNRRGHFGGTIDSVSLSWTTNIVKFGSTAFAGPLTFLNLYAESTYRIGDIETGSSNETAVLFQTAFIKLGAQSPERGRPVSSLSLGGQVADVRFVGCAISYPDVLVISGGEARFDGTRLLRLPYGGRLARNRVASPGVRAALNATCVGLIVGPRGATDTATQAVMWRPYERFTGLRLAATFTRPHQERVGDVMVPIHAPRLVVSGHELTVRAPVVSIARHRLTQIAADGETVRFELATPQAFDAPAVGDLVLSSSNGAVFFVIHREGPVVIMERRSPTGLAARAQTQPLGTDGHISAVVTRLIVLPTLVTGATTADHHIIDRLSAADGADLPDFSHVKPGASLYRTDRDGALFASTARIVSVDRDRRRIVMSEPALRTTDRAIITVFVGRGPQ